MSKLAIKKFKYNSKCQINRCSNRAEFSLGNPGENSAFDQIICKEHLKDMVNLAISEMGEELGLFTQEVFDTKNAELIAEIERLKSENADLRVVKSNLLEEIERIKADKLQNFKKSRPKTIKRPGNKKVGV